MHMVEVYQLPYKESIDWLHIGLHIPIDVIDKYAQ
jgi:hypothetical protein